MAKLPETTAYLSVTYHSWQHGMIVGEVQAANYRWNFQWFFTQGRLLVEPSLGRALIKEPLSRFLEHSDYLLEPGGNYTFIIRAQL
jgi:hypothetical protein